MEIKEYQENGMNIREIWVDEVMTGKEEYPIITGPIIQPINDVDLLKEQLAQMNNDFMDFQDFYFQMNPTQA